MKTKIVKYFTAANGLDYSTAEAAASAELEMACDSLRRDFEYEHYCRPRIDLSHQKDLDKLDASLDAAFDKLRAIRGAAHRLRLVRG